MLIVGGGPTAALAAASLREMCKERNVLPPRITIMDKARGFGGRMSTHKASGAATGSIADTGAQYLTQLSDNSKRWFEKLTTSGVIVPMEGELLGQRFAQKSTANYVAPDGISSVVRTIAASSEAKFLPSHRVAALNVVDSPEGDDEEEEETTASASAAGGEGLPLPPPKRQWSVLVEKITRESLLAQAQAKAAAASAAAGAAGSKVSPSASSSSSSPSLAVGKSSSSPSASASAAASSSAAKGGIAAGGAASSSSSFSSSLPSAALAGAAPGQPSVPFPSAPFEKFQFDAVVLTCPVPQILSIDGDVKALLEGAEVVEGLKQVTYSSRYSLILYYGPGDWAALKRALPDGCIGKYCDRSESDVMRFVAFDSAKRQRVPKSDEETTSSSDGDASSTSSAKAASTTSSKKKEPCPSVVVHTSVEFGSMYLDTDPSLVEPVIREHLKRMFPALPEPVETKCHRWRYSQVMRGYRGHQPFGFMIKGSEESKGGLSDSHGGRGAVTSGEENKDNQKDKDGKAAATQEVAGALLAVDDPPLILAGDAFTASHFDGCVVSGEKVS